MYEHRSRLEKSLQKERVDHKKNKEGKFYTPKPPAPHLSAVNATAGSSGR